MMDNALLYHIMKNFFKIHMKIQKFEQKGGLGLRLSENCQSEANKFWQAVKQVPHFDAAGFVQGHTGHTKSYLVILFDRSYKKSYKVILFGYFF